MSALLKLLNEIRANAGVVPNTTSKSSSEARKEPRRKRRKQDKRTTNKRRRELYRERGDEMREYAAGIKGMFFHLRREIKRRKKLGSEPDSTNCDWEISLGEWINMWLSCPAIEIAPRMFKPAWQCRGRDKNNDVQLKRVDVTKSFNINNLEIWYKGKCLWASSSKA